MGGIIWKNLLNHHPAIQMMREQKMIAALSRLIIYGQEGVVPVGKPLRGDGGFQISHTLDDSGKVNRLMLNLWIELSGLKGRTHAPPPPDKGIRVPVGRLFGEHVFTRPFGPIKDRKVTEFDAPGMPKIPNALYSWRAQEKTLELPPNSIALEDELSPDSAPIFFGLDATDSNQHVNSLIYPRLFEQAALRRLASLGVNTKLLSRYTELTYRKPFFAGQSTRIYLQSYKKDDGFGAVGYFTTENAPSNSKPHSYISMFFSK